MNEVLIIYSNAEAKYVDARLTFCIFPVIKHHLSLLFYSASSVFSSPHVKRLSFLRASDLSAHISVKSSNSILIHSVSVPILAVLSIFYASSWCPSPMLFCVCMCNMFGNLRISFHLPRLLWHFNYFVLCL